MILGEGKLLNFKKKNVRTSRDWVGNKWVELKPKPDILHYLSATASTVAEASVSGASALVNPNPYILKALKVEAVGEGQKVFPGSGPKVGLLENMQGLSLSKRLHCTSEDKTRKGGSDNSLVRDFESADQKHAAATDMEVVS